MKKCFVICPIGSEGSEIRKQADDSLKYIIEPACEGYEVVRADKISDSGMITQSIIEHLLTDDIAIVDLTGHNPNVFYELAIRHSFGLPAIQITRDSLSSIPFDVHNVRTIQYDLSASGADKAKQAIKNMIESIEKGSTTTNPVTAVSGLLNMTANSPSEREDALSELLLKVNAIPDNLARLENNIGIRFSQMLSAFAASVKTDGSVHKTEDDIKNQFLEKFMTTLMEDPEKGLTQMSNLMNAQKMLDQFGGAK